MAKLRVEIVTGEREVLVEDDVDMVVAPGIEGQLGILPQHAPLVTTLAPFVDSQQQVIDGPFRWQAEVYHEAEDLLAVHVRVVWPWPAQTHQVRLATYVSRH